MKVKLLWLLVLLLGFTGCTGKEAGSGEGGEITVFAAASLTDAFKELADEFVTRNEGVAVFLNFAGSSQLAAQLVEGVPADVFVPANESQMTAVIEAGRVEEAAVSLFVSNRLTVIVPAENPAGIDIFQALGKPGVRLILAVEGVPVRQYTDEIVSGMSVDFQERFYNNLVSEEGNVRQVAAKVALGEADAGIVYASDVTPEIKANVLEIEIPGAELAPAYYPIAPLNDAGRPDLAREFIDFVLTVEGQAVLARWGFRPVEVE